MGLQSKVEQTPLHMRMGVWNERMKCVHHKVSVYLSPLLNLYLAGRV